MTTEMTDLERIAAILDGAQQFEHATLRDARYTESYKGTIIAETWDRSKAAASAIAVQLVDDLGQAIVRATQALDAEQARFSDAVDYPRLSAAQAEAQALGNGAHSFEEVERVVQQAIATKDYATLRSLARIALPALRERQQQPGSALRSALGSFNVLEQRIQETLAEMEPESLRAARAKLATVQQWERDTIMALQSINFRWSTLRGGRGPIQWEREQPTVFDSTQVQKVYSGGRLF